MSVVLVTFRNFSGPRARLDDVVEERPGCAVRQLVLPVDAPVEHVAVLFVRKVAGLLRTFEMVIPPLVLVHWKRKHGSRL